MISHPLSRFALLAAILGLTFSLQPAVISAQSDLSISVTPGNAISVPANENDTIFIYGLSGKSKSAATCADAAKKSKPVATKLVTSTGIQQVTVSPALKKGDLICIAIATPGATDPTYSKILPVASAPAANTDSTPVLATPVVAGSQITVTAADKATVSVYVNPSKNPQIASCSGMATAALLQMSLTKVGSSAEQVSLKHALAVGDQVCLESVGPNSPTKQFLASPATVQDAEAATKSSTSTTSTAPTTQPAFSGKLIGGSSSLIVNGQAGSTGKGAAAGSKSPTISVYQFDAGYIASDKSGKCTAADLPHGTPLSIAGSGSNTTTTTNTTLTGTAPFSITLAQPLVADTSLCLVQMGTDTEYSSFQQVTDPNDFGRVRTSFTAGTIINNEQNSGKSSASEYLDFGIYYNWMRAGGGFQPDLVAKCQAPHGCKPYKTSAPGLDTFLNVLLNQVPVSAPATTTTSTSGGGASTSSSTLNLLSAQQSAQFVFGNALTWRLTRFYSNSNAFLLGPVAKGGFNTLLNPSISSSSSSSTTTTTVSNFSGVYDFLSAGGRLSWSRFGDNSDKAPIPIGQFDMTLGTFSNLPSYICKPSHPYGSQLTSQPTATSCFVPDNTTSGTTTTNGFQLDAYRTLVPRILVEGFVKLPNYPFIFGMDANLGQYQLLLEGKKIDPLSKPGNDVRIYLGVAFDPLSAIKKLGLPKQ